MALPDTPVVFESGVLRFDDDGTLHVHLSHSPQAPHPLVVQPEGGEDPVPADVSEVVLSGTGEGNYRSRASLAEAEALPEGLVLTFRGYEFVQVEMSGDVSVLMRGMEDAPDWFTPGKVHRFDGPEDGVRLWTGSSKPPAPPPMRAPPPRPTPPPASSAPDSASSGGGKGGGCGVLLVLVAMLPAAAWLV